MECVSFEIEKGATPYASERPASVQLQFFGFSIMLVMLVLFGWLRTDANQIYLLTGLAAMVLPIAVAIHYARQRKWRESLSEMGQAGVEEIKKFEGARVRVIGRMPELQMMALVQDVAFEPILIDRQFQPLNRKQKAIAAVIVFAAYILLLASPIARSPGMMGGVLFPLFATVVALIGWLLQRFRTTYYRIIPGRLDEMLGTLLSKKVRLFRSWDLRTGTLVIDLKKFEVVRTQGEATPSERISLIGVNELYKFTFSILQAAVSTHTSPSLPSDQLTA